MYGRIRYNTDAVGAVSTHESPKSLFLPHLGEASANGHLVLFAAWSLYLEEDLKALQWRHYCARYSSSDATCTEACGEWLRDELAELQHAQSILGLWTREAT